MPLAVGDLLYNNRYRIDGLLGQGGMGAVYRAWDTSLDIPVAVKENLDASAESQRQFSREASMLARLSHPNLPRVTDHFFIPGQGQYLVIDYVEGEDLQSMLARLGALPEPQVLRWISQVCDALAYLHSQPAPIVHRDIKPANIRVRSDGRAMLVDFGIAKVHDQFLATTVGAKAVTPGYSPPEQYGGGSTDPRSDIYALGATMYHLLTGQVPPESVRRAVGSITVRPPRQVNDRITPMAEQAILKAIEVATERRFQTVEELRTALTRPAAPAQGPGTLVAGGLATVVAPRAGPPPLTPPPQGAPQGLPAGPQPQPGVVAPPPPEAAAPAAPVASGQPLPSLQEMQAALRGPVGGSGTQPPAGGGLAGRVLEARRMLSPAPGRVRWWLAGLGAAAIIVVAAVLALSGVFGSRAPLGWLVLADKAYWTGSTSALPQSLEETLSRFAQDGRTIKQVALPPAGGWLALADKNYWTGSASALPANLEDTLTRFTQDGREIKQVTFAPGGGWVVLADRNYWTGSASALPANLEATLTSFTRDGREVKQVAFTPGGGWLVLADKNYWTGSASALPANLEATLARFSQDGRELKQVTFAPPR